MIDPTPRTWTTAWTTVMALTFPVLLACSPEEASSSQGLTDAQIAHIAVTANAIDIELAELARERTSDAEVVRFAETMIADHTAVNEQAAALAERLGLTPEDNPVSQSLREEADEVRTRLATLAGSRFDRGYIDHEVAYHEAVLEVLDETLIPGASNDELRQLLEGVRPAIAMHLEHARELQGELRRPGY